MRNTNRAQTARVTGLFLALLLSAGCNSSKKPAQKAKAQSTKKAGAKARKTGITRHSMPPLVSKVKLSIKEVEALLARAKPPKGGQVLALAYAGGIKGEIEPCG